MSDYFYYKCGGGRYDAVYRFKNWGYIRYNRYKSDSYLWSPQI